MMNSIIEDIKRSFDSGNMITRLIIVNIAVFMFLALFNAFLPSVYTSFSNWIYIPSSPIKLLTRPWTILTHMFAHLGMWHMAFNMLILYWFGRIVGDLLNDRRVLPLYLLGGFAGAVAYFLVTNFAGVTGGNAHGASAAVLCIVAAAAWTSPNYTVRLLFLGDVKIKWIAAAVIFVNVLATQGNINTGGAWGHLGGLAFGAYYVWQLRKGSDITEPMQDTINWMADKYNGIPKKEKTSLKVTHVAAKKSSIKKQRTSTNSTGLQKQVDIILDKIKVNGYDSLTDEEKEILFTASKK
ncbi:MAG TPA: rhomboid family intramembrane serine protease [Saprospirales bacterium]|nr:rhomboid family intramembrane serine protease [Saprospirales bacterium]